MNAHDKAQSMHWLTKSFYIVVIAGFAVLGLIGLVLPVIPGLVFLFLAVLLLTRVSSRFNVLAGSHAGFRYMRRRWRKMQLLGTTDRLKLGFWYCAGALVTGIESGIRFLQNRQGKRSSLR